MFKVCDQNSVPMSTCIITAYWRHSVLVYCNELRPYQHMGMDIIFTLSIHRDAETIVMRGISALFLLAPGLTGVVGGYLKAVRMIHIWLYDPTRRHIVYEMLQLWLSLASSSWLQVDQRHGGHIAPILWSQGIEANYCNCRSSESTPRWAWPSPQVRIHILVSSGSQSQFGWMLEKGSII